MLLLVTKSQVGLEECACRDVTFLSAPVKLVENP